MQAFSNIRVIDLTHVIAGPFCTYQLAVLGADVIKIESPELPDMVREDGASAGENERGMGSAFMAQNANKRSLAVDLKSPQGREIVGSLVRDSDVLVENYRSGALASLGLGYDDVRSLGRGDLVAVTTEAAAITGLPYEPEHRNQVLPGMQVEAV